MLDRGQLVQGPRDRLWMDGALFDITERRAAEEALRRQEIDRARTEELRASRIRIVEAADAARRRIERDLHDGAQQRLVKLGLDIRIAQRRFEKDPESVGAVAQPIGDELSAASSELRELARGIHPAVLTDRGLAPAIDALVSRATVPVEVLETPEDRLPPSLESTAYFTVAEALTNVAKYAQATHATVRSPARTTRSWSRSPTTASAARTPRAARASAGWPTASAPPTGGCRSEPARQGHGDPRRAARPRRERRGYRLPVAVTGSVAAMTAAAVDRARTPATLRSRAGRSAARRRCSAASMRSSAGPAARAPGRGRRRARARATAPCG